jgi:hypothetical protein
VTTQCSVKPDNGFVAGTQWQQWTTKGWKLLVKWKDGTSTWVPLKDLKDSNLIEVVEDVVANKLVSEPAFAWWVSMVLRQHDHDIMKVKSCYHARTHKFGIEIPKTVKRALEINLETGTDFWHWAIKKEMKNVFPAFQILVYGKLPPGYKEIWCHMIFDIKMDFTQMASFVAGGHLTYPPKESVYLSALT